MPDIKSKEHGPELPPSKWRLQQVPQPVLDSVVDALADLPQTQGYNRAWKSSLLSVADQQRFPFIPLSADLKAMSMTSKAFRRNVFSRKIVPYIELKTPKQYADAERMLTRESRRYVRYIAFLPLPNVHNKAPVIGFQRNLLQTMPHLENLADETRRVALFEIPLPPRMKRVALIVGVWHHAPPAPMSVRYLGTLRVEPSSIAGEEGDTPKRRREFLDWPNKVRSLTANLAELDELYLSPPPMGTCGCSHTKERPPLTECLQDLLGPALPPMKVLHYSVPWCSTTPGDLRWTHWWAYLGWLSSTEGSFETLKISMHWDMSYLRGPDVTPPQVVASMGFRVKGEYDVGERGAVEFNSWIQPLFERVSALQEIHITFTYTLPGGPVRSPIRTSIIERPTAPGRKPRASTKMPADLQQLGQRILNILHAGLYVPRPQHRPDPPAGHHP